MRTLTHRTVQMSRRRRGIALAIALREARGGYPAQPGIPLLKIDFLLDPSEAAQ